MVLDLGLHCRSSFELSDYRLERNHRLQLRGPAADGSQTFQRRLVQQNRHLHRRRHPRRRMARPCGGAQHNSPVDHRFGQKPSLPGHGRLVYSTSGQSGRLPPLMDRGNQTTHAISIVVVNISTTNVVIYSRIVCGAKLVAQIQDQIALERIQIGILTSTGEVKFFLEINASTY